MDDFLTRRQSVKAAIRSIQAVEEVVRSGGTVQERIERISREGYFASAERLRRAIIGGLEIRGKKGSAENLIIIGCGCFGTAMPLRAYCLLLQRLGVAYVFLEKEYCCGAPFMQMAWYEGKDYGPLEGPAKEFIGMNITQARERGVKNILYFCPWCAYLAKRFYPDCDVNLMYWPDILVGLLDKAALELRGTVGFFGGLSHRRPFWVPKQDFDLNWPTYARLLQNIKGLNVVSIPKSKYCCQLVPSAIFKRARREHVDTIVVDCVTCYGNLIRKTGLGMPGTKVKMTCDVLLGAIDKRYAAWALDMA